MNLLFRLIRVLVSAWFGKAAAFKDPSVLTFRVWPNDLDFNGHMNNGRYLTVMDLGRIDFLVRNGLLGHVVQNQWRPVVAYAQMRFLKSLKPWQRYRLVTRFLCWDSRFFYIQQEFVRGNEVVGVGMVKGLFVARGRSVATQDVLTAARYSGPVPEMPRWIKVLNESDQLFSSQAP